jgi:RNA recognition motif-containing protein
MMQFRPKIYVGNLPYDISENDLRVFLAPHRVVSVKVVFDRATGRPRGFAFVEMADEAAAVDAIQRLHQTQLGGRRVVVKPANERKTGDVEYSRSRAW